MIIDGLIGFVYEIPSNDIGSKVVHVPEREVFYFEQAELNEDGDKTGRVEQIGFPVNSIPFLMEILASIYNGGGVSPSVLN
jgi:hypothetical protein